MEPQVSSDAINALGAQIVAAIEQAALVPSDQRLVSKAWLMSYFGIKETAIDRLVAQPGFPAPVKVTGGPLRWVAGEVIDWALKQRR